MRPAADHYHTLIYVNGMAVQEGRWFIKIRDLHQDTLRTWTNSPMRERFNGFLAGRSRQSPMLITQKCLKASDRALSMTIPELAIQMLCS